jgi:hypothetical protein
MEEKFLLGMATERDGAATGFTTPASLNWPRPQTRLGLTIAIHPRPNGEVPAVGLARIVMLVVVVATGMMKPLTGCVLGVLAHHFLDRLCSVSSQWCVRLLSCVVGWLGIMNLWLLSNLLRFAGLNMTFKVDHDCTRVDWFVILRSCSVSWCLVLEGSTLLIHGGSC